MISQNVIFMYITFTLSLYSVLDLMCSIKRQCSIKFIYKNANLRYKFIRPR